MGKKVKRHERAGIVTRKWITPGRLSLDRQCRDILNRDTILLPKDFINLKKYTAAKIIARKTILYILLALVATWVGLFLKTLLTKDILVLKNTTVIVADEIWLLGETAYFRINKETKSVKQNDIKRIFSKGLWRSGSFAVHVGYALKAAGDHLLAFIPSAVPGDTSIRDGGRVGNSHTGVLIFILLVLAGWGIMFLVLRRGAGTNTKNRQNAIDAATDSFDHLPVLSSLQDIEQLFLNVFRYQMGAMGDAAAKIIPVAEQQPDSNRIYELQVKHHGRWRSRRMTIGPLGESAGSKSQCFHVVYDTHMVVKIPSVPINDFKEYVRRIKQETAIVKKLAPLECIIPNISMILEKMKIIPDTTGLSARTLEDKYINCLETYPKLQNHLKIGDTFVFFMDLSKYRFLSQVMNRLHNTERDIYQVISADADIIWNYNEFVNKYGDSHDSVCFDLQKVYSKFHQGVKDLSAVLGHADPLNEKEKMNWLLLHLAGKSFIEIPKNLPDQMIGQIKELLDDVAAEHAAIADNYKLLVIEYVRRRSFNRKRSQIEGIITNLLSLLDWMRQCSVAMRDIKPDNLLVAGDLESHPLLLASPEDYTIGLIDVETAVVFEKAQAKKIKQPQLGGTPLYATPSHFFANDLLHEVYADVATILFLQDWYAITGIVYELLTGEKLFLETANLIHDMIKKLRLTDASGRRMPEVYWNINRTFWHAAMEEFGKKMNQVKPKLNVVHVAIPDNVRRWFKQHWMRDKSQIDRQSKIIDSLENGAAKMSVYVLLNIMFNIVMDIMVATPSDAVATDGKKNDIDKKEDLPIDSELDSHMLGFTFTV
jgi:serine/threonine protein kinase